MAYRRPSVASIYNLPRVVITDAQRAAWDAQRDADRAAWDRIDAERAELDRRYAERSANSPAAPVTVAPDAPRACQCGKPATDMGYCRECFRAACDADRQAGRVCSFCKAAWTACSC